MAKNEIVDRLRDRRLNVWHEAKALADRVAEDNRNFSAEEQGQWDALNGELDELDKRIKSALDAQERQKQATDAYERVAQWTDKREGIEKGEQRVEPSNEELRAFLKGDPNAPRSFMVNPQGPVDFRNTLSKLTTGAGGSTVPVSFYDRLMAHLIEVSGLLQAGVTMLNTNSGESLTIPKTTDHGTAALTAEAGTLSASDPAFAAVSLGAFKYGKIVQVSRELLDDTGVDLEGYIAMAAGRALGNAIGADLVTGDGSAKPRGLLAATSGASVGVTGPTGANGGLGATSATANTGADLLIDLFYSVIAPYRASRAAGWLCRDSTMAILRKLKDTTGQYIFQPSLVAGTPDTMLGKPIYNDPYVPAMVTGTTKSVVFGDMSQYFVRMAGGVRFERSDEFAFNTDLVSFRAVLRGDGALVDLTGAVKCFQGGS